MFFVFYLSILSKKIDLLQATCSIIIQLQQNRFIWLSQGYKLLNFISFVPFKVQDELYRFIMIGIAIHPIVFI